MKKNLFTVGLLFSALFFSCSNDQDEIDVKADKNALVKSDEIETV